MQFDCFEPEILPGLAACAKTSDLMLDHLFKKISMEYEYHKKKDFKTIECPSVNRQGNEVRLMNRILRFILQHNEFKHTLKNICWSDRDICSFAIYTRCLLLVIKDMSVPQLKYLLDLLCKKEDFFYKCLAIKIYIHHFETLEDNFWEWESNPFFDGNSDFFQYSIRQEDCILYPAFFAELLAELLDKNMNVISKKKERFRELIFKIDKKEKNGEYRFHADNWNNLIRGLIPFPQSKPCRVGSAHLYYSLPTAAV